MAVTTSVEDGVAVVRLDDQKMNALSPAVVDELHAALDLALADATAVCLCGNDRAFSAGFDLNVMRGGGEGAGALVRAGGELLMRLFVHPQPTVAAVTGHALAAGALVLLACDTRIAVPGPSKIGLNETAIGMPLPEYAVELAVARLAIPRLTAATIQAEIYDPEGAVAAGFVDRLADDCVGAAIETARQLGSLPAGAYAHTKRSLRQPIADRVLATLR